MNKNDMSLKKNEIKRIDIFPHSGSKIPEEVEPYIRKDLSEKEISYTIEIDRDSGLEGVIDSYREKPADGQLLMTYDYTKVLGNVNRLEPSRQVPDAPYKGEKIVRVDQEIRETLVEGYVLPWQRAVIETVSRHPEAIVVQWHSMDIFGGGNATLKADTNGAKTLRPLGQIFTRGDAKKGSLLPYFPELVADVVETQLLDEEVSKLAVKCLGEQISPLASKGRKVFVKDYPYRLFGDDGGKRVFGPSLLNLIDLANGRRKNKQLAFEVRKDIFGNQRATEVLRQTIDELVGNLLTC
ncbi:MAG: hypothetical protein ACE5DX_03970 [Candidatus Dojkabacteria bacterium]